MNKLIQWIYKKRAKYYTDIIFFHINKGERVLDIGAGNGYISKLISMRADVTLIDIVDYNKTNLPLKLYDGKKLPFKDKSFGTGLLIAVLHHTKNQKELLKEAKRVCKRIIVIEDVYKTVFGKLFLTFWDFICDLTTNIKSTYNFNSNKRWRKIFGELNLNVESNDTFRNSIKTHTIKMFILR